MSPQKSLSSEAYTSSRKYPINLKADDKALFQHEIERRIPESYLLAIVNAQVTIDGVVFSKDGIVEESLFADAHKKFYNWIYFFGQRLLRRSVTLGKGLLIFNSWSFGYFHWMTEAVPRLYLSRDFLGSHTLILPRVDNRIWNKESSIKSFIKKGSDLNWDDGFLHDSLSVFNISKIDWIEPTSLLKVRELRLQTSLAVSGNYNEKVMKELRQLYQRHYHCRDQTPIRNVYITRRLAERRTVENEEDVQSLLIDHNYEVVDMDQLTFGKQVELMFETRNLVGLHGAGLTNMMFMQEGSKILELKLAGDRSNHCYFALANAMNLGYYYLYCLGETDVQNSDVFVDCEKLGSLVNQMN